MKYPDEITEDFVTLFSYFVACNPLDFLLTETWYVTSQTDEQ